MSQVPGVAVPAGRSSKKAIGLGVMVAALAGAGIVAARGRSTASEVRTGHIGSDALAEQAARHARMRAGMAELRQYVDDMKVPSYQPPASQHARRGGGGGRVRGNSAASVTRERAVATPGTAPPVLPVRRGKPRISDDPMAGIGGGDDLPGGERAQDRKRKGSRRRAAQRDPDPLDGLTL